jgi:PKD repeat protein
VVNTEGTTITALTPAHPAGTVNVTVTGTGIPSNTPLTLSNAFTYAAVPPVADLAASPAQGLPPLAVSFDTTGTTDSSGTIVFREIDFGDSTNYVFPSDLSVVTTTHTYTATGIFTATLTVRDNIGGQATATATIVVGNVSGALTLRSLAFKAGGGKSSKNTMTMTGEVLLPAQTVLAGAKLIVGFVRPATTGDNNQAGALSETGTSGGVQNAAPDATGAPTGGEFSGYFDYQGKVSTEIMSFSSAPLKTPGTPANTMSVRFAADYDLTYALSSGTLSMSAALGQAVTELTTNEDGTAVTPEEQATKRVGRVMIIIRIETKAGAFLQYAKLAVVNIIPGSGMTIKLVRP